MLVPPFAAVLFQCFYVSLKTCLAHLPKPTTAEQFAMIFVFTLPKWPILHPRARLYRYHIWKRKKGFWEKVKTKPDTDKMESVYMQ